MIRAMRVFRIFKAMRYSKSFIIIGNVLKKSKDSLIAVCVLAFGYILISALIIYNVEPDTFDTFFDALYWATVSLTTVGYGDIYPVSIMGRIITMVSSIFGIAIVALPAGIITAGYMTEIDKENDKKNSKVITIVKHIIRNMLHYFISCSSDSKTGSLKNSVRFISRPSQIFFIVSMDISRLDSSVIL